MIATPKIDSKLGSALVWGLSSGLGPGSTRARDYSDLFYHRGASLGSARSWLNSGLDLRLNSAWLGLALSRGSRISARGGRQGIDDLIWDGDERIFTYANTDLQLFTMFIAILCLNGVEQPFKGHQCPFFLPLRRRNPRLRRRSLRPRGGRRT